MADSLVLYSFHRCPFAMRVRIVLHEKALPFTIEEEDLKNFSAKLRELHPEAKVPVLVHGDQVIYESSIITQYLDDAFPAVALMPVQAELRAQVRLWTYWCDHHFKPAVDRLKYGTSRFPEAECVGIEAKVEGQLAKLEERLSKAAFLVGRDFSLADIHVFPFCRQLLRTTPTPKFAAQFPAVLEWARRVEERPSFQKTIARV